MQCKSQSISLSSREKVGSQKKKQIKMTRRVPFSDLFF